MIQHVNIDPITILWTPGPACKAQLIMINKINIVVQPITFFRFSVKSVSLDIPVKSVSSDFQLNHLVKSVSLDISVKSIFFSDFSDNLILQIYLVSSDFFSFKSLTSDFSVQLFFVVVFFFFFFFLVKSLSSYFSVKSVSSDFFS